MLNSLKGLLSRKNDCALPHSDLVGTGVGRHHDGHRRDSPTGRIRRREPYHAVGGRQLPRHAGGQPDWGGDQARRRHRQRAVGVTDPQGSQRQRHRAHRPGPHRRRFRFPSGAQRSERKTFVATYGAESQGNENTFDCVEPGEGDVVHISANTLMDHSASGIDAFLHRTASDPTTRDYSIVLNPTNTLHMVSDHLLEDLVLVRPIWSCNRQEAMTLAERLGAPIDDSKVTIGGGLDDFMHQLCDGLGATLRAPLVVRVGARGAWIREPGGETIHIEGYPTKAVHTRSAGGCHTGVMCAMLAKGHSLAESVKIANAAASIAIQHSLNGVPQCPDYDEAIALIGE